jgi:hypothetical protein
MQRNCNKEEKEKDSMCIDEGNCPIIGFFFPFSFSFFLFSALFLARPSDLPIGRILLKPILEAGAIRHQIFI